MVWTYYDFDFKNVSAYLEGGMNYGWMALSLFFGVLSHMIRGWRWNLALAPLGEYPKLSNSVYAVFVSYGANLLLPRVGEVSRCGVLAKYDGVSFAKSLGTVVAERCIDTLCVILMTLATVLVQTRTFARFFKVTGTDTGSLCGLFTSVNFYITLLCIVAALVLVCWLVHNLTMFARLRGILHNVWTGVLSIRSVHKPWLYVFYTLAIWFCYYLNFYLTLYCFDFSENLGWMPGLVMFIAGSIAVAVPTPNGAGPWHFAVITMMMMYGVGKADAGIFALLVHGIQTFLLILLGIYGMVALPLTNKKRYAGTHPPATDKPFKQN